MYVKMKLQHVLLAYYIVSIMHTVIAPVSTTVLLGEKATFSCSGEVLAVFWTINNISALVLDIHPTVDKVDNVVTSNLSVIGSAQYNNSSIQCVLVSHLTNLPFPPAFLTVLGKLQTSCTLLK